MAANHTQIVFKDFQINSTISSAFEKPVGTPIMLGILNVQCSEDSRNVQYLIRFVTPFYSKRIIKTVSVIVLLF